MEAAQRKRIEDALSDISGRVDELLALARQYRDDMRHPPADDSRQRRIEWINRVLGDGGRPTSKVSGSPVSVEDQHKYGTIR